MDQAAGLAVGAVGADECGGGEGLLAVGCLDVELDAGVALANCGDDFDLEECDTTTVAARRECLLQAEGVEALAHGHRADGAAGVDSELVVRCVIGGLLQDDLMADVLDDRLDGVAQSSERLAREPAGAGLVARKGAAIEQQNAAACASEVKSRSAARRTGAGDEGVVRGHDLRTF